MKKSFNNAVGFCTLGAIMWGMTTYTLYTLALLSLCTLAIRRHQAMCYLRGKHKVNYYTHKCACGYQRKEV
jgi:hypothetical protein